MSTANGVPGLGLISPSTNRFPANFGGFQDREEYQVDERRRIGEHPLHSSLISFYNAEDIMFLHTQDKNRE